MELESIVLLEIQKCLPGSTIQEGDARPQMPPQIMAGLTLQRPEQPNPTFTTTLIRRLSFVFGFQQDDNVSAPFAATQICAFGRGLWRIKLSGHYVCNETSTFINGNCFRVELLDPLGTSVQQLISIAKVVNGDGQIDYTDQFCFDQDGWTLRFFDPGTSATGRSSFLVCVHAAKIL